MACDFGELLQQVARGLERRAHQRAIHFAFDSRGPELLLDSDGIRLGCGLHRLSLGVQELIRHGAMMLDGRVRRSRSGQAMVTVRLWATGVLDGDTATEAVLRRLALHDCADTAPGELHPQPRLRRLEGECPCTGAHIRLARSPAQGVVAVSEGRFEVDEHGPAGSADEPQAAEAPAWVIAADAVSGDSLAQRLKRLGWAPRRFERAADAIRRLRVPRPGGRGEAPVLVLLLDGDGDSETQQAARRLGELLPPEVRKVLAVVLGSAALAGGPRSDGFEVIPLPLGATLLRRLTADAVQSPLPLPHPSSHRPLLVVDDEPINRSVAVQTLHRMGEIAEEAGDGLEAIARCRVTHPSLVLMDVDMPHLDGMGATRALRELQARGEVSPCPIVAATASLDPSRLGACIEAGMDQAMLKPLTPAMLRETMDRWLC
jgi:CheY-like chemotaxis protein